MSAEAWLVGAVGTVMFVLGLLIGLWRGRLVGLEEAQLRREALRKVGA